MGARVKNGRHFKKKSKRHCKNQRDSTAKTKTDEPKCLKKTLKDKAFFEVRDKNLNKREKKGKIY